MLRKEIINEWFFPLRDNGVITASPEAVEKYEVLKETWLEPHPRLPNEIPMVAIDLVKENGKVNGHFVRTYIVYKPSQKRK